VQREKNEKGCLQMESDPLLANGSGSQLLYYYFFAERDHSCWAQIEHMQALLGSDNSPICPLEAQKG